MTVYTRLQGGLTNNADYRRLVAAGWVYVSADRVRANYYNLLFRCQG